MEATFKNDSKKEQECARFLHSNFLPTTYGSLDYTFSVVTDRDSQFKGIDMILNNCRTGGSSYVDEKAALDFINNNKMHTFSFELSCRKIKCFDPKTGRNVFFPDDNAPEHYAPGWFYDPNKTTDAYLLMWAFSRNDILSKEQVVKAEDYVGLKVMLVNRLELQKSLASHGLTEEVLTKKAQALREEYINIKQDPDLQEDGKLIRYKRLKQFLLPAAGADGKHLGKISLQISYFKEECPVILVIPREFLFKQVPSSKIWLVKNGKTYDYSDKFDVWHRLSVTGAGKPLEE